MSGREVLPTDRPEPGRVRFVLICYGCEHAWEPDLGHLDPAELAGGGCRRCGGWTWLGEISEPDATAPAAQPQRAGHVSGRGRS